MATGTSRRAVLLCLLILLQEFGPAHFIGIPETNNGTHKDLLINDDVYASNDDNDKNDEDNDNVSGDDELDEDDDDDSGDNEEEDSPDDDTNSLVPQEGKTAGSSRRGWIKTVLTIIKVSGTVVVQATSLAGLAHAIYMAIQGCCGPYPKACKDRDVFLETKIKVQEKSREADNLQLEALNYQEYVNATVNNYNEIRQELRKIGREQDIYLETISSSIKPTVNNKTKEINDIIKAKNGTRDEIEYLQVVDMYETAINNAMNIGFPLMSLVVSGGYALYKHARRRAALEKTAEAEKETGIKLKHPKSAGKGMLAIRALAQAQLTGSYDKSMDKTKKSLNGKFKRAAKTFGKGLGVALSMFGAGMSIYSIITSDKDCRSRAKQAKEARDKVETALVEFDEGIANIKKAKGIIEGAYKSVHTKLTDTNMTELLKDTKKMVENANPNVEMVDVATDIQMFLDDIRKDKTPQEVIDLQIKLHKALFKIPFTIKCYTNKIKIMQHILNGCRKGTDSFNELYKSGQKLFNPADNSKKCERRIGAKYINKDALKKEVKIVMKKEKKSRICELNDPLKKTSACRYKNDGYNQEKIAKMMNLKKRAMKFLLKKCPEQELTPKDVKTVCNLKKKKWSTSEIVDTTGLDKKLVRKVKC